MTDDLEKGELIQLNNENGSNQNTLAKSKEEENEKYYEIKIAELEAKIKAITKEKNSNEAIVYSLMEQKEVLSDQLSSLIMEISEKVRDMSDLERTNNLDESNVNLLSSDRKQLIKVEENEEQTEEEEKMIYKQLEQTLLEKSDLLLKYDVDPNKLNEKMVYERLICTSVLIVYADLHSGSSVFFFQTFSINKHTVFQDLKNIGCDFWELDVKDHEFKFCNSIFNLVDIPYMHLNVDKFLKNQDNCENAIMILFPSDKNVNTQKLKYSLNQKISVAESKKVKNSIEIEDSVSEFFRRFVGLFTYMIMKLESVMKFLISVGDESKLDEKKSKKSIGVRIYRFFMILIHIVFLFFFLDTLFITSPTNFFYVNDSLSNLLSSHNTIVFNRRASILEDIAYKLNKFFLNDEGIKSSLLENFILVTPVRFNFYRTISKPCETFIQENITCNYFGWDDTTKNITSIKYSSNLIQIPSGVYILNNNKYNTKLEKPLIDQTILRNYISDSISNLSLNIKNETIYSIQGFMSTYTGNTYTLRINLSEMNFNAFNLLLLNLKQTSIFDSSLRCIIVTMTLLHPQTNRFIYIYFLYEINTDGCVQDVKYYYKIFSMNLYFGTKGQKLYLNDIIRLSLSSSIFLSGLIEWYLQKLKLDKKEKSTFGSLIAILIQPIFLTNYLMTFFDLFTFLIKFKIIDYDYTNISNLYRNNNITENFENDISNSIFWNQLLNYLETGMILVVITKFVMLLWEVDGIRVFTLFIQNSTYKLGFYIFFLVFILSGFSIFSNNLWGTVDLRFVDLMGSLSNVLMNSLGHIQIIENGYDGWNSVYIILFFSFFIYFLVNTFAGLFLEVYRISTIMKGHLADREKDLLSMFDAEELGGLTNNLLNNIGKGLSKLGDEIKQKSPININIKI